MKQINKKISGCLKLALCLGAGICVALVAPTARADNAVKVGALKFGTVNWELNTVAHHGYDREHGLTVTVVPFANKQATPIAFFNGNVDVFVSDWLWVSRARKDGKDISFIPYSKSLGALMVPATSNARALRDLSGKRVGVAGGSYDKSWLLLRAWAYRNDKMDLSRTFDVQYAAPPLLNGQIRQGHLDAVLNFWHYCARLESAGYRRLMGMSEVLKDLGIRNTPMVGYIFNARWARERGDIIRRFNLAVRAARAKLMTDDAEWERLKPLMKVSDDAMFVTLRERYREGIPRQWGEADEAAANQLTELFHTIGGKELTASKKLTPGTFWTKAYF